MGRRAYKVDYVSTKLFDTANGFFKWIDEVFEEPEDMKTRYIETSVLEEHLKNEPQDALKHAQGIAELRKLLKENDNAFEVQLV